MDTKAWNITCHVCSKTPRNTVEAPCCGAIFCWECVVDFKQCNCCGLELTATMCKPAVAIEKLLSERRKAEPTPETLVRCPECGAQVSYAGMEEHLSSCPQITISCPNGCEKTLLLLELVGHAAECPLAIVTCPHGCGTMNDTLTRHTLQAHMENYVQLHLQYLARKVEEQGEVIKAFEKSSPTGAVPPFVIASRTHAT